MDTIDRNKDFSDRLIKHYVDIGKIGSWGYPVNLLDREKFHQYWKTPWSKNEKYDLIVIDGRFRVQCFLYSLINANEGTIILFDDYCERPYYHVVEEIIKPEADDGRMSKFVKGSKVNIDDAKNLLQDFRFNVE